MIAETRQCIMTAQTLTPSRIPIVLCPLHFEAKALGALHDSGAMEVRVVGPGPDAIGAAVEDQDDARPLILAGLATSLRDELHGGQAAWIDAIHGVEHRPTLGIGPTAPRVNAVQVGSVLRTQAERTKVACASNAALADMECAAFAVAASKRSGPWGIVRGISDTGSDVLPPVGDWVDAQGRTRVARAAAHLLFHPWQAMAVLGLARTSATAMRSVLSLLRALE
jgi:hypothetical protein